MTKIYGIKTCDSVRKAIKYFKEKDLEYDFFDFKKETCDANKIQSWIEAKGMNIVLNKKGATYRKLGLSKISLDDKQLLQQMANNNMLIKRPVIEYGDKIIIGFDLEKYQDIFK